MIGALIRLDRAIRFLQRPQEEVGVGPTAEMKSLVEENLGGPLAEGFIPLQDTNIPEVEEEYLLEVRNIGRDLIVQEVEHGTRDRP